MISQTADKSTVRVVIEGLCPPGKDILHSIVCLVRLEPDHRIAIMYSHHILHTRNPRSGVMEKSGETKLPLTPLLIGQIRLGVMLEVWESICSNGVSVVDQRGNP